MPSAAKSPSFINFSFAYIRSAGKMKLISSEIGVNRTLFGLPGEAVYKWNNEFYFNNVRKNGFSNFV
jgi:hypothetical protein